MRWSFSHPVCLCFAVPGRLLLRDGAAQFPTFSEAYLTAAEQFDL